jgi:hypothetical protein
VNGRDRFRSATVRRVAVLAALTTLTVGAVSGVAVAEVHGDSPSGSHSRTAHRGSANDDPGIGGQGDGLPTDSLLNSNHQSAEGRDGASPGSARRGSSPDGSSAPSSQDSSSRGGSSGGSSSGGSSARGTNGGATGGGSFYRPEKSSDDESDEESDGPSHGGKGGKAGYNSSRCTKPVGPGAKTTQCTKAKGKDGADGLDQASGVY